MGGLIHQRVQAIPLLLRAAATYNFDDKVYGARGLLLFLNVTAWGGAGATLDVKVQAAIQALAGTKLWFDIVGASFTQKTQVGGAIQDYLEIYPSLTEAANKKVSFVMPTEYRVVAVVAVNSCTFGIEKEILW